MPGLDTKPEPHRESHVIEEQEEEIALEAIPLPVTASSSSDLDVPAFLRRRVR